MYSYIPDNLLIQGIRKKEFKYSDCELQARGNPAIIKVALSVNKDNVNYIPDSFWLDKSKDENFNIQDFLKNYPVSLAKKLKVSQFFPKMKNQIDDVKYLITKVIAPNGYYNHRLFENIDTLHNEYPQSPLFNSPDFLVSVINKIKKNKTLGKQVPTLVYLVCQKLTTSQEEIFLENYEILSPLFTFYIDEDPDFAWNAIPEKIRNNRDRLIDFFEKATDIDTFSLELDVASFLENMEKPLMRDMQFLKTVFKMLLKKTNYFDISWLNSVNFSLKNKKELDFFQELLVLGEENKVELSLEDFTEFFTLASVIKHSPETVEILISKPDGVKVWIESFNDQLFTMKQAKSILTLLKPENVKSSDLNEVYKNLRSHFSNYMNFDSLEGTKLFPNVKKIRKGDITVEILRELLNEILAKAKF